MSITGPPGVELGAFDENENKYREASTGMLHTRERCEAKKNTMRNNEKPEVRQPEPQQEQPQTLTLEMMDIRLKRVEKTLFKQGT